MNDTIKWDFRAETISDYLLEIKMEANNKLLHKIFNEAKRKLSRKKGMNNLRDADPENIEEFDIPERFYNLIHTIMSKHIKKISDVVKQDNIHVLNSKVHKAKFKRNENNDWDIYIKVTGQYVDKN